MAPVVLKKKSTKRRDDENDRPVRWNELGIDNPLLRLINEGVKQRLGGLHSASLLLHSVDFMKSKPASRAASGIKPGKSWPRRRWGWSGLAPRVFALYQYHAQSGVAY
jgi:hypothetical protein